MIALYVQMVPCPGKKACASPKKAVISLFPMRASVVSGRGTSRPLGRTLLNGGWPPLTAILFLVLSFDLLLAAKKIEYKDLDLKKVIEGGVRMNVGDRIKFPFGGKEKEGVVLKVFPKTVYLKVDFPHHPGKVVMRKLAELEGKALPKKKKARKAKAKKEKAQKVKAEEKKEAKEEKKEE